MNKKVTAMAHFRLHDTYNLINQLFVNFEPDDPMHSIDVYKSLGYELGKNVNFFRDNLNKFSSELQDDFVRLNELITNFLQNLVDIINLMSHSLEAPEGNIEQNSEYFIKRIAPLIETMQQKIERIIPKVKIDKILNANRSVRKVQNQVKFVPILVYILMSTGLAFAIRHYLDQIDYLGVFFLAMFFTLMFMKIESEIKGK